MKKTSSVLKKASRNAPIELPESTIIAPARTARTGPKPTLTKEQIACAAIAIADSDGLEAISMQRVARAVRVTTMALYRYFSSKAALIELMIDIAGGPPPSLDLPSGSWRPRLEEWTRRCSAIYRRHPWFLQATMTPGRRMGQNELGWLNVAFTVLARTGLKPRDQHQAFLALIGHVRSSAEFAVARKQAQSLKQWSSRSAKLQGEYRMRYPALASAIESGAFVDSKHDGLDFGLECILSGIESITHRRRRAQ